MIDEIITSDWRVTVTHRKRDRMKLQFKLNKEESQAFKNFMEQTRPNEINEDDFIKGIFNLGMQTLERQIIEKINEEIVEKQKLQDEKEESDGVPEPTKIID